MGKLELVYRFAFRRFVARVGVGVAVAEMPIGASLANSLSDELIVDTGSNITVLSPELAYRLGIDVGRLETRNLGGITGVGRRPFARNIEIFVGEEPERVVRLPLVAIAVADVSRGGIGMAPASWKGSLLGGPVSILGMDVARALRARLTLDFATLKGTLEW